MNVHVTVLINFWLNFNWDRRVDRALPSRPPNTTPSVHQSQKYEEWAGTSQERKASGYWYQRRGRRGFNPFLSLSSLHRPLQKEPNVTTLTQDPTRARHPQIPTTKETTGSNYPGNLCLRDSRVWGRTSKYYIVSVKKKRPTKC